MHELRAILFDFGGTLDGPGEPWVDRFAAAYRESGLAVAAGELREAVGYGTRQAYRTPSVPGFSLRQTVAFQVACQFAQLAIENPTAADAITARFVARTESALGENHKLLGRLAGRFQLGVVSNFYGNVARILADAGFTPLLAAVIDSTVVGVSKPDPRIFALAVERLGVPAGAALYVGDSVEQDILPAHAAGLRTAWVTPRTASEPLRDDGREVPADLRLRRLADLEQFI